MIYCTPLSSRQASVFLLSLLYILACNRSSALASSTSKTSKATGSKARQTHTVTVGKADHKFVPDVVQADVGDIVEFQFFPTNHSVIRAEYEFPCIPYEMTGEGKTGFFSGLHTVDRILNNPPTFLLEINDTLPVFFYCSAPGSCIDQRMVGVINPNGSVSLDVQKQKAADSSYVLNPGESFPDETPSLTTTSAPVPTSVATLGSGSAVETGNGGYKTSGEARSTDGGISDGAIAGIAVGVAALVAFGFLALLYCRKRRTQMQSGEQGTGTAPATPSTPQTVTSSPQSFLWVGKSEGCPVSELPS